MAQRATSAPPPPPAVFPKPGLAIRRVKVEGMSGPVLYRPFPSLFSYVNSSSHAHSRARAHTCSISLRLINK